MSRQRPARSGRSPACCHPSIARQCRLRQARDGPNVKDGKRTVNSDALSRVVERVSIVERTFGKAIIVPQGKRKKKLTRIPRHHENNAHTAKADRRHPCTTEGCEKRFLYPKDVRRHERTHRHDRDRPYRCIVQNCEYYTEGFDRQEHLTRHLRAVHPSVWRS